ncbi:protein piccolo isoform X1 [Hemibagrus wyckioides]|uniref:protein piccolo isoform X1 n=1 Tax=Hemibagrus wyckioides TaxID=337641 RepID=UPI00266C3EB2|nr:protein piccolo isoform X1 [Hemibagrus wyckioides]
MDDLDALLADLESSTANISKCPVFLPDETPYSFPSSGSRHQDDTSPPPVPPPPSSEALNGTIQKQADSHHSSQQSLGSAQKSTLSQDCSSPPLPHTEEDHVYSFPNKQKTPSDSSAAAMSSALGSNLSELDRLLLELNAVQQNTPSCTSTEDAAPPVPPSSSAHYIQENGAYSGITPAVTDKALRNGNKGPEEGRPTVESLLNELESSIPAPMPTPSGLQTEGHLDVPSEQQGRMSATSATRELDELMACLSDFKVQSNPSSLGSLNSEPLFDQSNSCSAIAEIHSPSAIADPTIGSPAPSLPSKPNCYFPLPSPPVPVELHIVEDSNETVLQSSGQKSALSALHSTTSTLSSSPFSTSNPSPDPGISDSVSMLSTELEKHVVLSQKINTTTTTTTTTTKVSTTSPGNQQHIPANPESLFSSSETKSTLVFPVPIAKSESTVSQPENLKTSQKDNFLSNVCLVTSPEPKTAAASPIFTFLSESPIIHSLSSTKPTSPTPPVSFLSVPKTLSVSVVLPESVTVTTRPRPPMKPEAPALEPSLDVALDNLLTMNFSKPEAESQNVATSVCKMNSAEHTEVFERPYASVDCRVVQPDMHTESEEGDGLLEDQSECRSELLDWADMELKLSYDRADGSMTPMTETSWMDDSLTPSSCPGTPDAQMDLPTLHPFNTMDRISASGHIKSVIRRTKETPNVHPMYRDGIIRRKMGPVIFHKSNSQDRLIEELQGKLGIARKERPKKQPDDWLTEGVIVMSNPKRLRDNNTREVDKIIIPPESPIPQRKVIPAPQASSPAPRLPPPTMEPKPRPTVIAVPVPPPPLPNQSPPIPPPSQIPREPTPPPQLPVECKPLPVPMNPPTLGPVAPPSLLAKPAATPPQTQSLPPASVVHPKMLVSVGCQTEYDLFFPPMQIMAQGKGPNTQVNKLDNMLGSLQSDLHKLGVKTVAKGVCGACCKPIVGQVVTAMGRTWHPEHFVCSHCQEEIGSRNFFERDGQPYCERDYHHLFSPRCYYCNGPILDKVVTALDRTWHPEHFFCAQCGAFFGPEGFHEKDGKAYCRKDYFDLFAPKCGGCARAILENYISALNSLWHPECFVCRECFTPFVNGSFFEHDGQPYCEVHYHERRGSLCSGCQKPITGRCITAMGKKFHPEHFVCAFCLKQLNKGTFKEQNDKPYCHACFIKLFS